MRVSLYSKRLARDADVAGVYRYSFQIRIAGR